MSRLLILYGFVDMSVDRGSSDTQIKNIKLQIVTDIKVEGEVAA